MLLRSAEGSFRVNNMDKENLTIENYEKAGKNRARNFNIPEKLFRDYYKFCVDRGESMSKRIRLVMIRELLENQKL